MCFLVAAFYIFVSNYHKRTADLINLWLLISNNPSSSFEWTSIVFESNSSTRLPDAFCGWILRLLVPLQLATNLLRLFPAFSRQMLIQINCPITRRGSDCAECVFSARSIKSSFEVSELKISPRIILSLSQASRSVWPGVIGTCPASRCSPSSII